ncbi:patatin-like phospholipase family protein [Tessaracoccus sp. MC1679]|uniref:patatin-like phospholipase family protein n=1 Tax=Tessaracoccus sp. MC1679 TaxID=2760313 RepID=UPI0016013B25|nr:patatin-like phospholipase family protein [Tessaracoccus sp. MC1679]MBB1516863.1 patatin-like phospholipase family protein [Tessaracoccus sp. MC1679]
MTTAASTSPYASPSLHCDIVMKGGITSGVIYPRAVSELAKTYTLSSVGGASAGAIAAAAAAAAELGRHSGGFEGLDEMPDELAALAPDGQSKLASFFQPTRTAAPLFRLMFSVAGKESGKIGALVGGLLRSFWKEALAGALVGLVLIVVSALGEGIASVAGVVGGLLLLVLGAAVGVLMGALRTFGRVVEDGFGMCTGMEGYGAGGAKPLTPWLYEKIQTLAGRAPGAPPLTFGDLRSAGVTLRVMTTNLTRHQPMAMPWSTREFYFDPDEMRGLFPADVVDWMVAHPPPGDGGAPTQSRSDQGRMLHPWPAGDDLPVIVATRMSLSFPVLISAVRLYAVDYTRPENQGPEGAVGQASATGGPSFSSVWFTDGGLCANLPVHFFDSPLPKHPTFAFNLGPFPPGRAKSQDQSENSYLPTTNQAGLQRPWFPLPTKGLGAWASFGLLMVHTAREWVDGAQMVMPGYRDRIVTVHHDHAEGGMNLSMPPKVVTDLAERGRLGAVKLVDAFAGPQPGIVPTWGWNNHRWLRFRTATSGLAGWLQGFRASYVDTTSGGIPYPDLAGPGADAPLPSYPLSGAKREALNERADGLIGLAGSWGGGTIPPAPKPAPRLRLVPDDGTAAGLDLQD